MLLSLVTDLIQTNVDGDIAHCVKCSVLARYRTGDELIE